MLSFFRYFPSRIQLSILIFLIAGLAEAQIKKLTVIEFKRSNCDIIEEPFRILTRIIDQHENGYMLTIRIGTSDECCLKFTPAAMLENHGLYLDYETSGNPCDCLCYYELTYKVPKMNFSGIFFKNTPIQISSEKYITYGPAFELLQGDTIDLQDKYGRKQGKWRLNKQLPVTTAYAEFKNDTLLKRVDLYDNGKIKSEVFSGKIKIEDDRRTYWLHTFANRYVEYFISGKIKTECKGKNPRDSYWDGTCKKWNEDGTLLYRGVYKK